MVVKLQLRKMASASCLMSPNSQESSPSGPRCPICDQLCQLENCVIDEHGRAVHQRCYAKKVSKFGVPSKYEEVEEILQQAREKRGVADQLINKSDQLIAAYKALTGQAGKSDRKPG